MDRDGVILLILFLGCAVSILYFFGGFNDNNLSK